VIYRLVPGYLLGGRQISVLISYFLKEVDSVCANCRSFDVFNLEAGGIETERCKIRRHFAFMLRHESSCDLVLAVIFASTVRARSTNSSLVDGESNSGGWKDHHL
jgi:hypothetical protein